MQGACRQKACACSTGQLPTAVLCLFDITLLSTPSNYVASMQFEAQLHLGLEIPVLVAESV